MSYALDIGPFSPQSWQELFAAVGTAFKRIVGMNTEIELRPVKIVNGKEVSIEVSVDSRIPDQVAAYVIYVRVAGVENSV